MSAIINGYCTLTEFKRYITPPAQTLSASSADDAVIESLIETASRRVDELVGRVFYPRVETKKYDIPKDNVLWLEDDLLAVTTLTNGDGDAIASTEYVLRPNNAYPKYSLQLRDVTTEYFEYDDDSSADQVISLVGIWGYHEWYATRAWRLVGTLAAAWASTTTLTATMTAGHDLDPNGGQILKIDSEFLMSTSVVSNTLTVDARGDNGSTAATHIILSPVYVWKVPPEIRDLTIEITKIMYRSRYGENVDVTSTYTPAGVIVTPRSLPVWAQEVINKYRRLV